MDVDVEPADDGWSGPTPPSPVEEEEVPEVPTPAPEQQEPPGKRRRLRRRVSRHDAVLPDSHRRAPVGLEEVLSWPDYLLGRAQEHGSAMALKRLLCDVGVLLNTDYSGMGCAEMSMRAILASSDFSGDAYLLVWRGSDMSETCRKILCESKDGPEHVFGNLMDRVTDSRRYALEQEHNRASKQYMRLIGKGMSKVAAASKVGNTLLREVSCILAGQEVGGEQWCYKHQKMCPSLEPPEGHPCFRLGRFKLAVAGTTCTHFSSMGRQRAFAGWSTLPFMILSDRDDALEASCHLARVHTDIPQHSPRTGLLGLHSVKLDIFARRLGDSDHAQAPLLAADQG